ncbi:MAG: hypothetical protein JF606_25850 [Burkholderiales bacterium]|nr:hypothetical protein [Burkholderiales bacterium]
MINQHRVRALLAALAARKIHVDLLSTVPEEDCYRHPLPFLLMTNERWPG